MGHCVGKHQERENFIEKKIEFETGIWDGLTKDGLIDIPFFKELFSNNFNLVEIGL